MAHLTRTFAILLFGLALILGIFAVMLAREPAPAPEHDRAPAHASAMARVRVRSYRSALS